MDAGGAAVRYFTCPPGAGSFLKTSLVGTGLSFMAAMRLKYEDTEEPGGGVFDMGGGRSMAVELVGDAKIRCGVGLWGCGVWVCGGEGVRGCGVWG